MKRFLVIALAAAMFVSPVMSTAQAMEPVRRARIESKEEIERNGRGRRRGGRRRGGGSGGWVAAGLLGGALIAGAIASGSRSSRRSHRYYDEPTIIYQQAPTVVYPSQTYVVPQTTYSYPSATAEVYEYDANGNLVPYRGGY